MRVPASVVLMNALAERLGWDLQGVAEGGNLRMLNTSRVLYSSHESDNMHKWGSSLKKQRTEDIGSVCLSEG
jgi:hypothetical protein